MQNYKDDQQMSRRKMILTGKGQIIVTPDIAKLKIGVQTNAMTVTEAQANNATISHNVIDSIKQLGITEIQTVQYQIEQLYDYQNGERIDKGFQVRNVFEVNVTNIPLVGTVIDTAVNHGANIVDSISFDVSNPDIFYQLALNQAVKNAIQKAKSVAASLKIMFDPIPILITESSSLPIPYSRSLLMRENASSTPIEPGNNQIEAMVTVEFLY